MIRMITLFIYLPLKTDFSKCFDNQVKSRKTQEDNITEQTVNSQGHKEGKQEGRTENVKTQKGYKGIKELKW